MNLLAQAASSDFWQFMETLDRDVVGACMVLSVIGFFGALIAISCTFIESRKRIRLAKLHKQMVDDLVARGYSPDDIEKVVYQQSGWSKLCGVFAKKASGRSDRDEQGYTSYPTKPVKHGV